MNPQSLLKIYVVLTFISSAFAQTDAGPLHVVTTTTDLKALVEAVGGDRVKVDSLATGREDPHFLDAKPSCMLLAKDADLWVRIGLELEVGYERLILDGSRNPNIRLGTQGHLDASIGVIRLEVPSGKVDRSMGDVHPQGNPHYWLDPLNARIMAKSIAVRLGELRPNDATYFNDRMTDFQRRLDDAMFGHKLMADTEGAKLWAMLIKGQLEDHIQKNGGDAALGGWYGRMRPLHGVKIVTYHRSWSYFTNRFGLNVIDELEPKPGIPPSPSHLAEVVTKVQSEGAKFLLMEPFYSREAPDWLKEKTGIGIVAVANSVGGQPEATDYLNLISHIVNSCAAQVTGAADRPGE